MQNVLQHGLLTSAIFPSEIADRVHDGKSLLYKNWDVRGSGEQMALLHAYVRNWMGWRQGMLILSILFIIYYLLFIVIYLWKLFYNSYISDLAILMVLSTIMVQCT